MKKLFLISLLVYVPMFLFGAEYVVNSPDGRIAVTVSDDNGTPQYEVKYDGKTFIGKSFLGLITDIGDFSRELMLNGSERKTINESYSLRNIKQSNINYSANEMICRFDKAGKQVMSVIFRVSDQLTITAGRGYSIFPGFQNSLPNSFSFFSIPILFFIFLLYFFIYVTSQYL